MKSSIEVTSPASIANLGPGFDVFALALGEPRDRISMSLSENVEISEVRGLGSVPLSPEYNSVTLAAKKVFEMAGCSGGFKVSIHKKVDVGKGLGSSGGSAAAGAFAANHLLGSPLGRKELLEAAGYAEEKTAGSAHYDNVAASLFGGFVIVGPSHPPDFVRIEVPQMKIVIAVPEDTASTRAGRRALPKTVALSDSVANVGKASLMVSALMNRDLEFFSKQMVDSIVEPLRTSGIKGVEKVKAAAVGAGALGAAMSGAGPSVFAILKPEEEETEVKKAMKDAFEMENIPCKVFVTEPGSGCNVEKGV